MAICTFFGHRDTPRNIEPILKSTLADLIENKGVDMFYVGNNGSFDYMVEKNLRILKRCYQHIEYAVVLAYMPKRAEMLDSDKAYQTVFPEGLENVPPKYAISKRNHWMIKQSDFVVTYVEHNFGGASTFKKIAEKQGKQVLNLYIR